MSSSGGGAGGSGGGDERRYDRNLQGLLQLTTSHTNPENTSNTNAVLDPERREFLNSVMASMAANDPVKVMLEQVKVIVEESDVTVRQEALDGLLDYAEDIDLAKDFDKIGGHVLLDRLLKSEDPGIRWRGAGLIAALAQNNPYWQNRALELGLLPTLLVVLDTDSCANVRIKALSAVSCLSRDTPEGLAAFTKLDGFSTLLRAMQAEEQRLQTKSAFMLRAMIQSDPSVKETLMSMGMVEQLVGLLQGEHNPSHEYVLAALFALATNHNSAMAECRRNDLGLRTTLESRVKVLKDKPENEEEYEHAENLLKMVFTEQSTSSPDR